MEDFFTPDVSLMKKYPISRKASIEDLLDGSRSQDRQTVYDNARRECSLKLLRCFGSMAHRLRYAEEKQLMVVWLKSDGLIGEFLPLVVQRLGLPESQTGTNWVNEMAQSFHSWLLTEHPKGFIRPWGSLLATLTDIKLVVEPKNQIL